MKKLPAISEQVASAIQELRQRESIPAGDVRVLVSPYRLCPLGAHIDHQGGAVLGRTVATGTVLAYAPLREPRLRLHSQQYGQLDFPLGAPPNSGHWARYAQAAALALGDSHPLAHGFAGYISGTLIGTGLGSSASVSLAYLLALAQVNDLTLTEGDLVDLEYRSEHELLHLQIGILDPASIVHGRGDALLHIDVLNQVVTPIPDPPGAGDWAWMVAYSGLSRQLTQSGYNHRVDECQQAAELLQAGASRLSDVPPVLFSERLHLLPEPLRRRAAHYFSEIERVHCGLEAWGRGDASHFGSLMNASCESSIQQYESGHPVIIDLHSILRQAPGVYGGRFSGAGYGGCVIGLVQRDSAGEAMRYILREFAGQHPQLASQAGVYLVETDRGLRFAEGV